jgi:DNA-binding GntR family transcriptional regulator
VTGTDRRRGKGQVFADIAAELRRRIEEGEIPPGAPIGTLRDLSAEFHVAKGTIERAVNQLRDECWVYSRTGSGTFVLGPEARPQASDTVEADLANQLAEIRAMLLQLREDLARRDDTVDQRFTDLDLRADDLARRIGMEPGDHSSDDQTAVRRLTGGGAR